MTKNFIRIGNQTCCRVSPAVTFKFAVENGFDAFEWFSDPGPVGWNENDFDARKRLAIKNTGLEKNIRFSVHAPWTADPTTAEGEQAILRSIDFAGDIGAALVNIHLFDYPPEVYVAAVIKLAGPAVRAGVRISCENTPATSPESINAVFSLLEKNAAGSDRFGLCLDMGHANIFPETRENYPEYVERIAPCVPIIHWHAHCNHGDADSHLPLFHSFRQGDEAKIRHLVKILKMRNFSGSVVMEQWPDSPDILVRTRQQLLKLWETVF